MKLVFASNNKHKLEEVRQILPATMEIISLNEIGFLQEIDEIGDTLESNSALKAEEVWKWLKNNDLLGDVDGVFADDTGLEIHALGGMPGVRTARWAGDGACDVNNRQKALRELFGVEDRSARFRTVVTLIRGEVVQQVEGMVRLHTQKKGVVDLDTILCLCQRVMMGRLRVCQRRLKIRLVIVGERCKTCITY